MNDKKKKTLTPRKRPGSTLPNAWEMDFDEEDEVEEPFYVDLDIEDATEIMYAPGRVLN